MQVNYYDTEMCYFCIVIIVCVMTEERNNDTRKPPGTDEKQPWWRRAVDFGTRVWDYCTEGVWEDPRRNWKVNVVKTLNLTVRSFLNSDLQSKSCAMTYRTMLAVVPALALLFAIGRGFGFQNLVQGELFKYFPAQQKALETALGFVDSYLAQASEGIFVGVGIVLLLWTLISLLMNVEDAFNSVWGVATGRSIWRKVTDYTAILIVLPVLMICSGGISIFMSGALQKILHFGFMTPFVTFLLDFASYFFSWLFFTGAYMLIPNTKVKFANAAVAGVLAGTSFQLLQWVFVSGQMYVAKYNAIYGSFSFLPLMLIWLQLTWLITLTGALVCCSSQNIFRFSFEKQINGISLDYRRRVCLAIMTVIVKRFKDNMRPITGEDLTGIYGFPPRLIDLVVARLLETGLIVRIATPDKNTPAPLIPAMSPENYTVARVISTLRKWGSGQFIPGFDRRFGPINEILDTINEKLAGEDENIPLTDIDIKV